MAANVQRYLPRVAMMLVVPALCLAGAEVGAQTPQSEAVAEAVMEQPKTMDAARAKVWNSPNMLRARAWLYDRISKSAKITPEEGQKYITTLESMTPDEMKLWLMKFDEEEEQRQQQYSFWQQSQQVLAKQANAEHRATQQGYANINTAETGAAQQEQGELNEEAQVRQERSMDNQFVPYGPYGPAGGYYGGYGGGVHYHFHMYPGGY